MDLLYDTVERLGGEAAVAQIAEARENEGISSVDMRLALDARIVLKNMEVRGGNLAFTLDERSSSEHAPSVKRGEEDTKADDEHSPSTPTERKVVRVACPR